MPGRAGQVGQTEAGVERRAAGDRGVVRLTPVGGDTRRLLGQHLRRELAVHAVPQHLQGLGAQLGDPRLRDPELLGELAHRPVLEEAAAHDLLQALRQRVHRVAQVGLALALDEHRLGGPRGRGQDRVGARVGGQVVDPQDDGLVQVGLDPLQLGPADAHGLRELVRGRRPAQVRGQRLVHGVALAHPAAQRTGGPVGRAELVQQRAADAARGVPCERHPVGRVEGAGGTEQRAHAGRGEVIGVDVPREPHADRAHFMVDEGHVGAAQLVNRGRVSRRRGSIGGGHESEVSVVSTGVSSRMPNTGKRKQQTILLRHVF